MIRILRGMLLMGVLILLAVYYIADPATLSIFPRCLFHTATGLYCPGCGSQRAIHSLLHLNLAETLRHNLLFIPAFLLIAYDAVHPVIQKKLRLSLPDLLRNKYTPWVILVVVLLFWITRNLPYYPFSVLAPA